MSIFNILKRSKQAAKEFKEEKKAQEKAGPKVAYKHVPVHAANDALTGAPSCVRSNFVFHQRNFDGEFITENYVVEERRPTENQGTLQKEKSDAIFQDWKRFINSLVHEFGGWPQLTFPNTCLTDCSPR